MKRLTTPIIYHKYSIENLLNDADHILMTDKHDHEIQVDYFHKAQKEGKIYPSNLLKMENRLINAELRMDLFMNLLNRLQGFKISQLIRACDSAERIALSRGRSIVANKYSFLVNVDGSDLQIYHL